MSRDIVVIGASAGGVEALTHLVQGLPRELSAAVFVTQHFPATSRSVLPQILARADGWPAKHAENGETIEHGMIYVAPPDYHLIFCDGKVGLSSGPRENGHRPAIDTMFRSAASSFGPRVVGVILTGNLDDGVAGLMTIKASGGAAAVQDPKEAFSESMPSNAVRRVRVDRVERLDKLGPAIADLVRNGEGAEIALDNETVANIGEEKRLGATPPPVNDPREVPGMISMFTCPECHGALWELREDGMFRYRCHVGHSYTEDSFLSEKAVEIEGALWSALRALQEHGVLLDKMWKNAERRGHLHSAKRFLETHRDTMGKADLIREALLNSNYFVPPDEPNDESD